MITPKQWLSFPSDDFKLEYLKRHGLYPKTLEKPRMLCYCGLYSDYEPVLCDAVGTTDKDILVIAIGDRLHCIHPDYLSEMQTGRAKWLKEYGVDLEAGSAVPAANSMIPADFVVFDIETTGLSMDAEIINIAAIHVVNGQAIDTFDSFVQPKGEIPDEIVTLTGIGPMMVLAAPPIEDVLPQFFEFVGDSVLVGQNIKTFDIPRCNHWAAELRLPQLNNKMIDTLEMARGRLQQRHYDLKSIADALGVAVTSQHQALIDCEITLACFLKLAELPTVHRFKETTVAANPQKSKRNRFAKSEKASAFVPNVDYIDPNHPAAGKVFVITGDLEKCDRDEAYQQIVNVGAVCADNITKKTNYLVLGVSDSEKKSGKQKKAEEYIAKGQDLRIITESAFWNLIEG